MVPTSAQSGDSAAEALLEKRFTDSNVDGRRIEYLERSVPRRSRWFAINLILFNIAALVTIYYLLADRAPTIDLAIPSDHIFPPVEYETRSFKSVSIRPGPRTDAIWEASEPRADGFFMVEKAGIGGLPPGMDDPDFRRYGVTWAHQYHCLAMLREEFWGFVAGNSSLGGKTIDDKDADGLKLFHLAHCFDYLRNMVLCNLDLTIEYPSEGGANEGAVTGYEIPHRCKKRDLVDRFMEEHAPPTKLDEMTPDRKHQHGGAV